MSKKDIGYILTRCGLSKNSNILEAGIGSASLTIYLSRFCNQIKSYEFREDHLKVAKCNLEKFECENVEPVLGDLFENFEENEKNKNYDLVFLDMLNVENIFKYNLNGILKTNQYLVLYITSVNKIAEIEKLIDTEKYLLEEISEISLREWKLKDKAFHPKNRKEIDFTAFLIFIRKLK
jgi:tRNA A58 N-methylase Trm61